MSVQNIMKNLEVEMANFDNFNEKYSNIKNTVINNSKLQKFYEPFAKTYGMSGKIMDLINFISKNTNSHVICREIGLNHRLVEVFQNSIGNYAYLCKGTLIEEKMMDHETIQAVVLLACKQLDIHLDESTVINDLSSSKISEQYSYHRNKLKAFTNAFTKLNNEFIGD